MRQVQGMEQRVQPSLDPLPLRGDAERGAQCDDDLGGRAVLALGKKRENSTSRCYDDDSDGDAPLRNDGLAGRARSRIEIHGRRVA